MTFWQLKRSQFVVLFLLSCCFFLCILFFFFQLLNGTQVRMTNKEFVLKKYFFLHLLCFLFEFICHCVWPIEHFFFLIFCFLLFSAFVCVKKTSKHFDFFCEMCFIMNYEHFLLCLFVCFGFSSQGEQKKHIHQFIMLLLNCQIP